MANQARVKPATSCSPGSLIRAFAAHLQNHWKLLTVTMESKDPDETINNLYILCIFEDTLSLKLAHKYICNGKIAFPCLRGNEYILKECDCHGNICFPFHGELLLKERI